MIKRIEDRSLLKSYHEKSCIACGSKPCDPAHIKSQGSGGLDLEWNLIPLCRKHHSEQHQIGWKKFSSKYLNVLLYLKKHGWTFLNNKLSR